MSSSTLQHLPYLPLQTTMPLMNPQYPPQYYQKFTLLKKHIQLKLYTPQANSLAQQLIPFGQTNYNCWYVKKMCYLQGVISCLHQMAFSQQTLYEKIKNFQLWEHRRFLIERNPEWLEGEYALIERVLEIEPKNYHAWSHRTWVVEQVKNFKEELQGMRRLLEKDVYNNSVWAYRSFLVKKIIEGESSLENKKKIVDMEIGQCLAWLSKYLNNQSAWNYIRGYLPSIKLKSVPSINPYTPLPFNSQSTIKTILTFLNSHLSQLQTTSQQQNFKPTNYHIEAQIQLLISLACLYSQEEGMVEYARNTCLVLAEKDQQKRYYWKWVEANL